MAGQGVGVTTPGSGNAISKAAVRGVDSFGMLCSAHDIGWSDKADGQLVVMPEEAQPGDACPADPPQVGRYSHQITTFHRAVFPLDTVSVALSSPDTVHGSLC